MNLEEQHNFYFIENLLKTDFKNEYVNNQELQKLKIKPEMIVTSHLSLSDEFLEFNLDLIKQKFTMDAWGLVQKIYKEKLDHSTCSVCNEICYNDSICCVDCDYWYHFACVKPSVYFKRPSSKWRCNKSNAGTHFECRKSHFLKS